MNEKVLYVVHSDMDENNLMQEFEELADALDYAKDNIDEQTYIEEVVCDEDEEIIYSAEVIWSYDEDDAEDQVICEWCHELAYESECRKELNLGLLCRQCQSALYSRGEKPVFEEAYDSDYAEGDDIFEQDFEDAKFESKYVLDEFMDLSVNANLDGGDNNDVRVLSSYDPEAEGEQLDEFLDADINVGFTGGTGNNVGVLGEGINLKSKEEQAEFNQLCKEIGITKMKDLVSFKKEVGCTDENILQALRDYRAELGPDFEIINEEIKRPKKDPKTGLEGLYVSEGDTIHKSDLERILTAGGEFIVYLDKSIISFNDEGVSEEDYDYDPRYIDAYVIRYEDDNYNEGEKEYVAYPEVYNDYTGNYKFWYDCGDSIGYTLDQVIDSLTSFPYHLTIINDASAEEVEENLTEGYKIDLPQIRVRDIRGELDLYGDITFNLTESVEESDENGWRGASEITIVEKENREYEGYYQWLDQDGDIIESDADEYFDDFEELLYWLDDYLVNIVDLEEYIGSEIVEGLEEATKMTRDEMIEKEGTDDVELINAGRPEEERVELEESQSQEIGGEYERLSKKYGIDFEDLVYGEGGFMQTKYPGGFPDFDGDVIYSEKYFSELEDFMPVWKEVNELIAKSEARGQKLKKLPTTWLENEKIRRELENPAIQAKARFVSPENNIYVFPEDIFNDAFNNKLNESSEDTIKEKLEEIYYPGGNVDSSYERLD